MSLLLLLSQQSGAVDDVTVAVGGVLHAYAQGGLTASAGKPLSGQSYTVVQGSLVTGRTQGLSGISYTTVQGSLTVASSKALAGTSFAAVQGSVSVAFGKMLTGQVVPTAQGAFSATQRSIQLTGQVLAYSQCVVTASTATNSVTVALTGQAFPYAQGGLGRTASVGLAGTTATFGLGNVALETIRGVAGTSISTSTGAIGSGVSLVPQSLIVSFQYGDVSSYGGRRKVRKGISVLTRTDSAFVTSKQVMFEVFTDQQAVSVNTAEPSLYVFRGKTISEIVKRGN